MPAKPIFTARYDTDVSPESPEGFEQARAYLLAVREFIPAHKDMAPEGFVQSSHSIGRPPVFGDKTIPALLNATYIHGYDHQAKEQKQRLLVSASIPEFLKKENPQLDELPLITNPQTGEKSFRKDPVFCLMYLGEAINTILIHMNIAPNEIGRLGHSISEITYYAEFEMGSLSDYIKGDKIISDYAYNGILPEAKDSLLLAKYNEPSSTQNEPPVSKTEAPTTEAKVSLPKAFAQLMAPVKRIWDAFSPGPEAKVGFFHKCFVPATQRIKKMAGLRKSNGPKPNNSPGL